MNASVWQTPVALISTMTSPASGPLNIHLGYLKWGGACLKSNCCSTLHLYTLSYFFFLTLRQRNTQHKQLRSWANRRPADTKFRQSTRTGRLAPKHPRRMGVQTCIELFRFPQGFSYGTQTRATRRFQRPLACREYRVGLGVPGSASSVGTFNRAILCSSRGE